MQELARVKTDEEIAVAEQNKERQVIVALKAKESTEALLNLKELTERECLREQKKKN